MVKLNGSYHGSNGSNGRRVNSVNFLRAYGSEADEDEFATDRRRDLSRPDNGMGLASEKEPVFSRKEMYQD